ncbi:EAL domain-containing protein [Marinimicrobium alkaliphilum]|uniref:EAL domain-containing protein n=1 Tax=Marinimicrobium alkaliphilum TaxID=2202654 RepID=UPI001E4ED354|nr:EAL domain-containing protein [Marinimicrobium alkaliphilum]
MAFQPIIDSDNRTVYAYEALVRGLNGEGAWQILNQVTPDNRYQFDQMCRIKAIQLAGQLGIKCNLSINFLPNAVYQPEACIRLTLEEAARQNFPCEQIIFEVNEGEKLETPGHLENIFAEYRNQGFITAIDDFGAGHAGLNLLADFQPHVIKLDMALIRDINNNRVRQAIVRGVISTCQELDIKIIAEGIESKAELDTLRDLGVHLFQGYYFARPEVETLPPVDFDCL